MASDFGYQTAAQVRNRCNDVDSSDYSDANLDDIISKKEHRIHYILGRDESSPWTSSDAIYSLIEDYVLESSACEVYGGIDNADQERESACTKASETLETIQLKPSSVTGVSGTFLKTQGFNNRDDES